MLNSLTPIATVDVRDGSKFNTTHVGAHQTGGVPLLRKILTLLTRYAPTE